MENGTKKVTNKMVMEKVQKTNGTKFSKNEAIFNFKWDFKIYLLLK